MTHKISALVRHEGRTGGILTRGPIPTQTSRAEQKRFDVCAKLMLGGHRCGWKGWKNLPQPGRWREGLLALAERKRKIRKSRSRGGDDVVVVVVVDAQRRRRRDIWVETRRRRRPGARHPSLWLFSTGRRTEKRPEMGKYCGVVPRFLHFIPGNG